MKAKDLYLEIKADKTHGASEVSAMAAECMEAFSEEQKCAAPAEYFNVMGDFGQKLVAAQPSMAPVFNYINEILLFLEECIWDGGDVKALKEAVKSQTQAVLNRSREAQESIYRHTLDLMHDCHKIMTISYSKTAINTLIFTKNQGIKLKVILGESRPFYEGRKTANILAENGIETNLLVDMAAFSFLDEIDMILIGCDSVCQKGIVNKIGTKGLALAASHFKKPIYVLCEKNKFLPSAYQKEPLIEKMDFSEILEDPGKVKVTNIYFDITPFELFTGLVTEDGIVTPSHVSDILAEQKVSAALLTQ